jgi:hypothetical protein
MKPEAKKLKRLHKLEKLRAIAKRNAAAETARAEGTLAQLQTLAGRSRSMADSYRHRAPPANGTELREVTRFTEGLRKLVSTTESDAAKAREVADRKLSELAEAERRRSAVEERIQITRSLLAKGDPHPAAAARAKFGTGLE